MEKVLIICGWSVDFACAAAIMLRKYPNAGITASSKGNLPLLMEALARDSNDKFELIMIAGIPLTGDERRLKTAFGKLRRSNTRIVWLSSYPVPRQCPASLEKLICVPRLKDGELLCREVTGYLEIQGDGSGIRAIEQIAEQYRAPGKSSDAVRDRIDLIEAGMSRYRRFQDMEIFREIIRIISRNRSPGEAERKILEEYRQFGKRELRGSSQSIREVLGKAKTVGREGNCGVLITGESGTGKETVASLIHGWSPRSGEMFIAFNCADLSPQLLESRLFGHEKGAFTGAAEMRQGAFELADGGTLFLDEVAELPPMAQAGLLRVLQEGRFYRLGGQTEIRVDVRVIAATNRNLAGMIQEGTFREDLFYRINVINIHIPPLRNRPEDIPAIADSYLLGKQRRKLSEDQISELQQYHWPGNVRELQNIIERAAVLNRWDFAELLREHRQTFSTDKDITRDLLEDAIRSHVREIYRKHNGNGTHTAKALGISYNTMKKYL
jgi:transcriptional regulator with PAS, ATPase and Fis domain